LTDAPSRTRPGAAPFAAPADLAARASGENFPVAPLVLPVAWRRDLLVLYGYARLVDWIGDELDGDRQAALDWVSAALDSAPVGDGGDAAAVLARTRELIERRHLSREPFRDLIEANRRDQIVHDYRTFDELVGYCRLSADPVGRVVLGVLDATSADRVRWSDDVCTALQLVEHWQDIGEDARRGRRYLPAEDRERFGVVDDDLLVARASPPLRALVLVEAARARALLAAAVPLVGSLPGRARLLVAGFAAGGHAALDSIERAGGDVLATRCRPSRAGTVRHVGRLLWRARGAGVAG
jgi:squalene synthase HpnC